MFNGVFNRVPNRQAKQRGLTLVELLVAISVLGFIAVLGWRGLDSIVRARIALTGELEQTRGMQITFAQLQSDCALLADASSLLNPVPIAITPDRLMLIRKVFNDNQPSRLQVITYQLENGVLTRYESTATRDLRELDTLWQAAANGIDAAQAVTLQSNVTALTMRLWTNKAWVTGISALTPAAGASAVPAVVPNGLEVTMKLHGRDAGMQKIFLLGAV